MRLKLLTKEERKANERFAKLTVRLRSDREAERLAAAQELREQWPDGLQRLLTSNQALKGFWIKRRQWGVFSILWMLTGVVFECFCRSRHIDFTPFMGVFAGPLVLLITQKIYGPKVRNFYTRNLLIFDDVKIVGPLVDALGFRDEIMQQEARQGLAGLLPRLQASDAHLLNGEQREQLRQMLFTDYTELKVSVLKAYEHIGDGPELEAVERLMQFPIWDVEVRDAAERCLPFLQLRAQQMQSSQSLLRASQPAASPDILLRPAGNSQTEDQTQLLRMSNR